MSYPKPMAEGKSIRSDFRRSPLGRQQPTSERREVVVAEKEFVENSSCYIIYMHEKLIPALSIIIVVRVDVPRAREQKLINLLTTTFCRDNFLMLPDSVLPLHSAHNTSSRPVCFRLHDDCRPPPAESIITSPRSSWR